MHTFDSLQAISSRLNEITQHLESGKSSADELEEFEVLARALYERAVILHYKAKEEVYTKKNIPAKEEPVQPVQNKEIKEEPKKTAPRSGMVEFDFSAGFDTNSSEEAPITKNTSSEEKIEKPVNSTQQESTQKSTKDTQAIQAHFANLFQEASKDKMNNSKISSISQAIGLNDKLLFIHTLFNDDATVFNETVATLDKLNGMNDALRLLSELTVKNNWDVDILPVQTFAHLVNRRYVE